MPDMTDRDAAFMWETQAMRESSRRSLSHDPLAHQPAPPHKWATLREAYHLTGIPIETLRKWARKEAVPSYLDDFDGGVRRMVRVDAVLERAARLGRDIAPVPRPMPDTKAPDEASPPVTAVDEQDAPPVDSAGADRAPDAPQGTMIVPIAAWDKMLMQLGNLHEAGQQLAEARERAAKAETEALFLRERLGELRREQLGTPTVVAPEPEDAPPEPPPRAEKLWRYVYRGWRSRRR